MCETNIKLTKKKAVVGYKLVSIYNGDYIGYFSYIKLNIGKVPRLSKKVIELTNKHNAIRAFSLRHVGKITMYKRLKDIEDRMQSCDVSVVRIKASGKIWSGKDGSGVTGTIPKRGSTQDGADCYLVEHIDEIKLVKQQMKFFLAKYVDEVRKILEAKG